MRCYMANIFLVEGETEIVFLKYLKVLGSVRKFNIWEHNVQAVLRGAKSSDRFYIVFDTDLSNNIEKQNTCLRNLVVLQQNNALAGLVQQTKDLEDELVCALNMNKNNLLRLFNARNLREFKSNFIAENNLKNKLGNLDLERLWVQDTVPCLRNYSNKRIYYRHLKIK